MTELERQLMSMLQKEKEEQEKEKRDIALERTELASTLKLMLDAMNSIAKQQKQIMELLQKPPVGDSLETTLWRVLGDFQESLLESLELLLTKSK